MRQLMPRSLAVLAMMALVPATAAAHTGHDHASGLVYGFLHPVGGLDHVLAMVAVGLLAWHLGGRARWMVPAAFVVTMAAGGAIGMAGVALPFVEAGIAVSIVVVGGLIALGRPLSTAVASSLVAVFAVFHGFAHGAEMAAGVSGLAYGLGFVVATALLHGLGLGIGAVLASARGLIVARMAGAAVALAGIAILVGVT
jgi:urease accessory protein